MATKPVKSVDTKLVEKARTDPRAALISSFKSSFGITLREVIAITKRLLSASKEKENSMIDVGIMCITASTQVRTGVSFITTDYGNIRVEFPEFVLSSTRQGVSDSFNFSAIRMVGHTLNALSDDRIAEKANKKAGNCVTGSFLTDNEAGKINREIYNSHSSEDKTLFSSFQTSLSPAEKANLKTIYAPFSA